MPDDLFPALVAGAGLNAPPPSTERLRARMAEVYDVAREQLLPVRDAAHGLSLLREIAGEARHVVSPSRPEGVVLSPDGLPSGWLIVDESLIDYAADGASLARAATARDDMAVLRSLSGAYGIPGAQVGAVIASSAVIARLEAVIEPAPLPGPSIVAAEAVLSPSRALAVAGRIELIRSERARMAQALEKAGLAVTAGEGPFLFVRGADAPALQRFGVKAEALDGGLLIPVGPPAANDRALAAFGASASGKPPRLGQAVRDTKETRIVAVVDLDRAGDVRIETGVGFYNHMLEQVATHGGFSLRLACEGDLHIDPHHTIEDSAIALGLALKQALGDRAGIGRFGFTAPMDEAEASVSIDLSGRAYAIFDGTFEADHIGDYPTALTAHVFRSLAESLGGAIHVKTTGQDDHHKTEIAFKALGRALRQAIRVEGGAIPSTKGVL